MKNDKIHSVLQYWGISAEPKHINNDTWAVGDNHLIKVYHDAGRLQRNMVIMKSLGESGIPVAGILPTLKGLDYIEEGGCCYLIMERLSGDPIQDIYQDNYRDIAYKTGSVVGRLHKAFLVCEKKIDCWNNSFAEEMTGWVSDTLKAKNYPYIAKSNCEYSIKKLLSCYDKLPKQLIHRDIHYGNLLFDQGEFSGYIDFDLSQKNVRVFDISYFLAGLLVEHDKKKEDIAKWFDMVTAFVNGYERVNPLSNIEKDSISCLMENIELLFAAYFLGEDMNDLAKNAAELYSFMSQNSDQIDIAVHEQFYVE